MELFVNYLLFKIIYLEYPEKSHEKEIADEKLEVAHDDLQLESEILESTVELSQASNNKPKSQKTTKLKDFPTVFEDKEISDENSDKDEENEEKSTIIKRSHKLKNERSRSQCQVCGKMYAELSRYVFC